MTRYITITVKEILDIIFVETIDESEAKHELAAILVKQLKYSDIGPIILSYFGIKSSNEFQTNYPESFGLTERLFGSLIWRVSSENDKI